MDKTILEHSLVTPNFCGSDAEICAATQSWSSALSVLSGFNSCQDLTDENRVELFHAILHYAKARLSDAAGHSAPTPTAPPYSTQNTVTVASLPTPVVTPPQETKSDAYYDAAMSMQDFNIRNESKMLQRMRELAGIPHPSNRV